MTISTAGENQTRTAQNLNFPPGGSPMLRERNLVGTGGKTTQSAQYYNSFFFFFFSSFLLS